MMAGIVEAGHLSDPAVVVVSGQGCNTTPRVLRPALGPTPTASKCQWQNPINKAVMVSKRLNHHASRPSNASVYPLGLSVLTQPTKPFLRPPVVSGTYRLLSELDVVTSLRIEKAVSRSVPSLHDRVTSP